MEATITGRNNQDSDSAAESRGGAPIEAGGLGGHDPPLFEAKGDWGT